LGITETTRSEDNTTSFTNEESTSETRTTVDTSKTTLDTIVVTEKTIIEVFALSGAGVSWYTKLTISPVDATSSGIFEYEQTMVFQELMGRAEYGIGAVWHAPPTSESYRIDGQPIDDTEIIPPLGK